MSKYKNDVFHVITNTHWDREWRFAFQRNRQMLVDMIDSVLEILENEPEFRAYHLDSQSIVLKDYLEIKPHNKERIKRLARDKRLLHGPWYILPEEFQVGGENLIRNLLFGHAVINEHGGVSKIGYSPFSWGQISQLPQIYNDFDINLIMFYRGINSIDSPKAEFIWRGADNTEMISSRFSTLPRYNFFFYVYRPVAHNEQFSDTTQPWDEDILFHPADPQMVDEDYTIISPHTQYHPENIEEQVNKLIEDQYEDFTTPHKIWMEGHDSSGPNVQTARIIQDIKKKMPHLDVRHSTLEEYAEALYQSVDRDQLSVVDGERRSAQHDYRCWNLYGYTTSARMYLKQMNFDAERWIQYYAEPFNIFSMLMGRDIKDRYPEKAWELLVENSAHDSIGGCSLERIHEDMVNRYKQSKEISTGLFSRASSYLVRQMNTGSFPTLDPDEKDNGVFLTVINPLNYTRTEVAEAFIDIPTEMDQGDFEILDADGNSLRKEILEKYEFASVVEQMINRPKSLEVTRYRTLIRFEDLSSFALKAYHIRPVAASFESQDQDASLYLENEYLRVDVNENGTLNITDKVQDVVYNRTAWFYDEGEAGQAWIHKKYGLEANTLESRPRITKSFSASMRNEICIEHEMELPVDLNERGKDNPRTNTTHIRLRLSLQEATRFLEMDVDVDNHSESHRLRMMFPSGLKADHSYGEGQFDVVKRSLQRPDTSDWVEQPMYDYPMHHFVDLTDGDKGMAVLVDGLKEYEVLPDEQNTLAITLFRGFEYKINPAAPQDYSHEKGTQMLGHSSYRLAFYPHAGDWQEGQVYKEAYRFNYHLRMAQSGPLKGSMGTEASFLEVEPDSLVVSTLKKAEDPDFDGFVLRLFNPSEKETEGLVKLKIKPNDVWKVTMEEKYQERPELLDDGSFRVYAPAKKILTYKIKYGAGK